MMKQNELDIIKKCIESNASITNATKLADIIVANPGISLSHSTIRRKIPEIKLSIENKEACIPTSSDQSEIVNHEECTNENENSAADCIESKDGLDDSYNKIHVTDRYEINRVLGEVVFEHANVEYVASIILVDKLHLALSKSGFNMTQDQASAATEISAATFNAIKWAFKITKNSNVLSDFSIENTKNKKVYISNLIQSILPYYTENSNILEDSLIKESKAKLIRLNSNEFLLDEMINNLKDKLQNLYPKLPLNVTINSNTGRIIVVLSDVHCGVKIDIFNIKILRKTLLSIAKELPDDQICDILLLGDIMHNISGVMHPGTWKESEEGLWGADAIIKPFEIFYEFFRSIPLIGNIYYVGGE